MCGAVRADFNGDGYRNSALTDRSGQVAMRSPSTACGNGPNCPLWRTHTGVWSVDTGRAVEAGLRCRPLTETITDTWAWLRPDGRPVDHPRWAEHGLAPEKEAKILAALASAS